MRRFAALFGATIAAALAAAGAASADVTLGYTIATGTGSQCGPTTIMAEVADDPSTPYTVPAGGGKITRWQINASGATPGVQVTLVVLAPAGPSIQKVVALDTETLPNPLPAGGIVTFAPSTPVAVSGGDVLGLYSSSTTVNCWGTGGGTPSGDAIQFLQTAGAPTIGMTPVPGAATGGGSAVNVVATLVTAQDAGVSTAATGGLTGQLALLSSSVTNAGPNTEPITFTDTVPAGLTIGSAVAGSGTCATSAQQVTCTLSGLATGQSAPVDIVVTPSAAGSYTNAVSVSLLGGASDPNAANNAASAGLTVTAPAVAPPAVAPPARCVVPALTATPVGVARHVLTLLNCTPGSITHAFSATVPKGTVIRTTPSAGTYSNGARISLVVSSGPKPKPKPKKKKHPKRH